MREVAWASVLAAVVIGSKGANMKMHAVLAALLLCGCMQRTVPVYGDTGDTDSARYREAGTASIIGQGLMREQGGGVVTCAGSTALLLPDLPPTHQGLNAMYSGYDPNWSGEKWANGRRSTTCDTQGNFEFNQLPAANWYVLVTVVWEVAGVSQRGTLAAPAATQAGQQLRVLLTDANLIAQ